MSLFLQCMTNRLRVHFPLILLCLLVMVTGMKNSIAANNNEVVHLALSGNVIEIRHTYVPTKYISIYIPEMIKSSVRNLRVVVDDLSIAEAVVETSGSTHTLKIIAKKVVGETDLHFFYTVGHDEKEVIKKIRVVDRSDISISNDADIVLGSTSIDELDKLIGRQSYRYDWNYSVDSDPYLVVDLKSRAYDITSLYITYHTYSSNIYKMNGKLLMTIYSSDDMQDWVVQEQVLAYDLDKHSSFNIALSPFKCRYLKIVPVKDNYIRSIDRFAVYGKNNEENVATGKSVIDRTGDLDFDRLIDGNFNSPVPLKQRGALQYTIDLEGNYDISQIYMSTPINSIEGSNYDSWHVEVSQDKSSWKTLYESKVFDSGFKTNFQFTKGSCITRYIRLTTDVTSLSTGYIAGNSTHAYEYRVFGEKTDALGVAEQMTNGNEINVFPIPSSRVLNIESKDSQIKVVEVYDLVGRKVKQLKILSSKIDISTLDEGSYLLNIKLQNGKVAKKKIIVNR
ncbi:T9SS type A sorting domain-containing protein [Halosquirtibacter xylanolyticus]|uniref:discoidin domain-containing protein n=1 Tax=Halosquirtibacter xylanolyticus TaxID=3374599 RepID=UPI0037486EB3|nr:T9SS type A sorting domain-containing protein [Prolixibacteraceae bacterium]